MAYYFMGQVHQYRLEADMVRTHAQATLTMCESYRFESFRAQAAVLLGWATAVSGDSDKGIYQIRAGLEAWQATGTGMRRPYFLALLADALLREGHFEEGLSVVAEAEALIESSGETRWQPETIRLKGVLASSAGGALEEVEPIFLRALKIAQDQEAKLLELRTATSLSQVWLDHGRLDRPGPLLEPLCNWFAEGHDIPDLQNARKILAQLPDA